MVSAYLSGNSVLPPWLVRPIHRPDAAMRLICLPHAGGGASSFHSLAALLPRDIEMLTVQLPGRESRLSEPPFRRMAPLIDALTDAVSAPARRQAVCTVWAQHGRADRLRAQPRIRARAPAAAAHHDRLGPPGAQRAEHRGAVPSSAGRSIRRRADRALRRDPQGDPRRAGADGPVHAGAEGGLRGVRDASITPTRRRSRARWRSMAAAPIRRRGRWRVGQSSTPDPAARVCSTAVISILPTSDVPWPMPWPRTCWVLSRSSRIDRVGADLLAAWIARRATGCRRRCDRA